MKKYLIIALGGILLFGATGCGKKNQITCTNTTEENGEKMTVEEVFEFDKDDKVNAGSSTYTFSNADTATQYCEFFKSMIDSKYSDYITCTDKKITVKNLEEIQSDSEFIGMSRDDVIKNEEAEGYSCK